MIEAAKTTASTAEIWVIVVVMSIFTAFLVTATSVADAYQRRATRRRRAVLEGMSVITVLEVGAEAVADAVMRRSHHHETAAEAPGQSGAPLGAGDAASGAARAPGLPSQRTPQDTPADRGGSAAEAPTEPIPAQGGGRAAQGQGSAREQGPVRQQGPMAEPGHRAEQGSVPQQGPTPESAGARGRPARGDRNTAGDQAPAGATAPAGDPGRHAPPAQRSGESDRAERSFTGPSNPDPDDPDQR